MPVTFESQLLSPASSNDYRASQQPAPSLTTTSQAGKPRRRLKKKITIPPYSPDARKLGILRDATTPIRFSANDEALTGVDLNMWAGHRNSQPQQVNDHNVLRSKFSFDSVSSCYSDSEVQDDDDDDTAMDDDFHLKRTRAKTPCFYIGQLENKPRENYIDPTTELADEYQEVLPLRTATPSEFEHLKPQRVVRKVKGQQSLRAMCHRSSTSSMHTVASAKSNDSSASDSDDTLVGSPRFSPTSENFPFCKPSQGDEGRENPRMSTVSAAPEKNDIGFQICLDLLTNELSTALFEKQPAKNLDKPPELQILLMIEAYEAVRQDPNVTGHTADVLDNWLTALYKLYDGRVCSRMSSFESCQSAKSVNSSSSSPSPNSPVKVEQRSDEDGGGLDEFCFNFEEQKLMAWGARDERSCNT